LSFDCGVRGGLDEQADRLVDALMSMQDYSRWFATEIHTGIREVRAVAGHSAPTAHGQLRRPFYERFNVTSSISRPRSSFNPRGRSCGRTAESFVGATAGGDERRLRGIPAVGRGCGGAIRATNPVAQLMRRECG